MKRAVSRLRCSYPLVASHARARQEGASRAHLCPPDKLVPRTPARLVLALERPPLLGLDDVPAPDDLVERVGVDVDGGFVEALEEVPQVVDGESQGLVGAAAGVARVADGAVVQLRRGCDMTRVSTARQERWVGRRGGGEPPHRLERLSHCLVAQVLDPLIRLDRASPLRLARLLPDREPALLGDALEEDEPLLGRDVEVVDAVPEEVERGGRAGEAEQGEVPRVAGQVRIYEGPGGPGCEVLGGDELVEEGLQADGARRRSLGSVPAHS